MLIFQIYRTCICNPIVNVLSVFYAGHNRIIGCVPTPPPPPPLPLPPVRPQLPIVHVDSILFVMSIPLSNISDIRRSYLLRPDFSVHAAIHTIGFCILVFLCVHFIVEINQSIERMVHSLLWLWENCRMYFIQLHQLRELIPFLVWCFLFLSLSRSLARNFSHRAYKFFQVFVFEVCWVASDINRFICLVHEFQQHGRKNLARNPSCSLQFILLL